MSIPFLLIALVVVLQVTDVARQSAFGQGRLCRIEGLIAPKFFLFIKRHLPTGRRVLERT